MGYSFMFSNPTLTIAHQWFAAFNAHDLEDLLTLYADDAQHYSPKLKIRQPATNGLITGKKALRSWWQDSFDRLPSLSYEPTQCIADDSNVFMEYGDGDGCFLLFPYLYRTQNEVGFIFNL
jgi:hypothetical protein